MAQRRLPLPAAMAACAVLAAWTFHVVFGATAFLLSLCLGWGLLVLAIVDWVDFRLPDLLTFPLIGCGILAATLLPAEHLWEHAAAAVIAYTLLWIIAWAYRRLRGREGLGMGDAKLAAAAGAWLGVGPLPSVLLLASLAGIAWVAIAAIFRGRATLSERIPFGVPLSIAVWIVWLYGPLTFASAG
jgi:leader peptidase (prepilin peptidase)/N-methyltransferase